MPRFVKSLSCLKKQRQQKYTDSDYSTASFRRLDVELLDRFTTILY